MSFKYKTATTLVFLNIFIVWKKVQRKTNPDTL